jgi:hypothetical protein
MHERRREVKKSVCLFLGKNRQKRKEKVRVSVNKYGNEG